MGSLLSLCSWPARQAGGSEAGRSGPACPGLSSPGRRAPLGSGLALRSCSVTPQGTAQGWGLQPVWSGEVEPRAPSPISTPIRRRRPPFRPLVRQECACLGLGSWLPLPSATQHTTGPDATAARVDLGTWSGGAEQGTRRLSVVRLPLRSGAGVLTRCICPVRAGPRLTATRKPRTCRSVRTHVDTTLPSRAHPGAGWPPTRPSGDKRPVSDRWPEGAGTRRPGAQGCRSPAWRPGPSFLAAPPVLFCQRVALSAFSVLAGRSDHGSCDVLLVSCELHIFLSVHNLLSV